VVADDNRLLLIQEVNIMFCSNDDETKIVSASHPLRPPFRLNVLGIVHFGGSPRLLM
jgi:hypothetical protein